MKIEYSFEKHKHLLMLEQLNREDLLEAAKLLVDSLYAHKDFIDSQMKQSLGIN
jgi:hypothetical protein